MINRIVQFALRQRMLVLLMVAFIAVGGAIAFHHMPVDAYPDLAPPMWRSLPVARPRREEVERCDGPDRSGDERRSGDVGDAFHLPLRIVGRHPDLPGYCR